MMKKLRLTAAALALLAALSVNVSAAEEAPETAPAPETAAEEVMLPAEISFPGMIPLNVTSSMSASDTDTSRYFDKLALTGYELHFGEEKRTYTVYASIGVRDYADLLAVQMDGESYTSVEVAVYGSNDDETWVQINVTDPTEENGFYVFDLVGCEEKYTFWRIDFTMGMGEYFTLTEIALFKQDRGEPEYIYDLGDEVLEGELPELIPADPALRLDVELVPEVTAKPFPYARIPLIMGFGMGK